MKRIWCNQINALYREEQIIMFTKIFKSHGMHFMGAILVGVMVLVIPASTVSAAAPTATPPPAQTQPARQPANLQNAYQKELQALKTQDANLTRVDTMVGKAYTFLTTLKDKGRDVEILQTVLNQFNQDLPIATGFHDQATQILNTHAGFDNNGIVTDQAQAQVTIVSARDKLYEAHLTLQGGISDVQAAIQLYRNARTANPQSSPSATPAPASMPTQ